MRQKTIKRILEKQYFVKIMENEKQRFEINFNLIVGFIYGILQLFEEVKFLVYQVFLLVLI
jgi:hypothetical protein